MTDTPTLDDVERELNVLDVGVHTDTLAAREIARIVDAATTPTGDPR